jgi:hypothetical protein
MDQSAGVVLLIRWAASNILKNVILNLDQGGWTHRDRLHPNFTHSDCLTNTRNWEGIVDGLSQAICNELNLFRDYTARPLSKNQCSVRPLRRNSHHFHSLFLIMHATKQSIKPTQKEIPSWTWLCLVCNRGSCAGKRMKRQKDEV